MKRKKQIEKLLENIQILKHRLFFGISNQINKGDITSSQWLVLRQIQKNKGTTLKEIAKTLSMTSSAATQLVEALVQKGYVVKKTNSHDKRELKLILSNKSKKHMLLMRKKRAKEMENIFSVLTDKEFIEYFRMLEKVVKSLK